MIKDYARGELKDNMVFHFKNSLRPFIVIFDNETDRDKFLDLSEMFAYSIDELNFEGLAFYTREDDPDFMGVEVDGFIDWVDNDPEEDYEPVDIDDDCGFDPYMGCFTDDC